MPPSRLSWRLLLTITALLYHHVAAFTNTCTALEDNLLTSDSCPAKCGSSPCVLFSPLLQDSKPCAAADAAGKCLNATRYTLPGTTTTCNITYQCLDSLVLGSSGHWTLFVWEITQPDAYTMAFITKIKDVVFNTSDSVTKLILGGDHDGSVKGSWVDVAMDDSIFDTPPTCTAAYFADMDMRSILTGATLPTTWTQLQLINDNLDSVPSALSGLSLTNLDLSKNYIASFPNDSTAAGFDNLTELYINENNLISFNTVLPAIETLNLSGNALNMIPDAIYSMKTLKNLYMTDCNLSNLVLSLAQYNFLQDLHTFSATIDLTASCPENAREISMYGEKVCVRDVSAIASTDTPSPSPTTATASSNSSSVNNMATLVIFLCGCGCIIVAMVYQSRKQKPQKSTVWMYSIDDYAVAGGDDVSTIWNDPDLFAVRIEFSSVEVIKLFARGGFCEVWLGKYMNNNVAVKRLLPEKRSQSEITTFISEIKIMARLDHPKIVHFIGASWMNPSSIQAVNEFMDSGDLKTLLDSNQSNMLTWADRKCEIAIDIADALMYLHTLSPKLIHRDLKSRNVLIDSKMGAKLSDFGISRGQLASETMTAAVGTSLWMAPEVIISGRYSEAADIYSFGVILSELDTCKAPFHDATNSDGSRLAEVRILQLVSTGKKRPTLSSSCPPHILKLAYLCMQLDPAKRPSAGQISYKLRKFRKASKKT